MKLFDAIAAHGRGVTLEQARELLPAIPLSSVTSAAHRLSSNGALILQRNGKTIGYSAKRARNPPMGAAGPLGSPLRHAAERQARPLSPTCAACTRALGNVPTR